MKGPTIYAHDHLYMTIMTWLYVLCLNWYSRVESHCNRSDQMCFNSLSNGKEVYKTIRYAVVKMDTRWMRFRIIKKNSI